METNKLTIIPPEGMEAYQEGNEIKFRPINKLTYNDIAKELFYNKRTYYITNQGNLQTYFPANSYDNFNNSTSDKQLKKLLAINKLMNVAKYLNGDWQPNWNDGNEIKYFVLVISGIEILDTFTYNYSPVYFQTKALAQQAIEILGEETIKLALSTDW